MSATDEIRHALRSLRRAPTFAVVSIASLAIGIGANVTVSVDPVSVLRSE